MSSIHILIRVSSILKVHPIASVDPWVPRMWPHVCATVPNRTVCGSTNIISSLFAIGKQVECLFVRAFVYVKRVYERVRTALIASLSPLSFFGCCLKEVPVSPRRKDVYSGHSYSILNHPM